MPATSAPMTGMKWRPVCLPTSRDRPIDLQQPGPRGLSSSPTDSLSYGEPVSVDRRGGNSYDFVRFCAAAAVLFSHHFDLAGLAEPQVPGLGEDFGEVAVEVFFCLSGFLLTLSLQRSRGWTFFVAARFMRIAPNLAFALIAASAATFLWYGNLDHVQEHVAYVRDNLLMFVHGVRFDIAGVFTDTVRSSVNDPIWTLPYELWCYVVLALLFVAGVRRSGTLIVAATLLVSLAWGLADLDDISVGPLEAFDFARLASYFLSGAVLAVVWPRIKRHAVGIGVAGLLAVFVTRNLLPVDTLLQSLALAAAVVGLGSAKTFAWFARGGDASYGIYVFAWPVQQLCLLLVEAFLLSMFMAFAITAALGYATWHAFEKRAIALPHRWMHRRREPGRLKETAGDLPS